MMFYNFLMVCFVVLCLSFMAKLALRQHRHLTGRLNRADRKRILRRRAKQRKRRLARTRR